MGTRHNTLLVSFAALFFWACGQSLSTVQTDLGSTGNALVEKRFYTYVSQRENGASGCHSGGGGRRILITGFGPFQSVHKNISGFVAGAVSNTSFWPTASTWRAISSPPPSLPTALGDVPAGGITATQRDIVYNGAPVTICSLVLAVEWDLAAAAIIYESQQFSPDTVLMMGRGGHSFAISLEAAAVNEAAALPGFSSTGDSLKTSNTPVDKYVLPPSSGAPSEVRLSWNTQIIAKRTLPTLEKLNSVLGHQGENAFRAIPQTAPSNNNTYICNNISFAVQNAFAGIPVSLAGGKIELSLPNTLKNAAVGFFHFPTAAGTQGKHVWAWSHLVLATALEMKP